MSNNYLELKVLKPIPKKYLLDQSYRDEQLKDLTPIYGVDTITDRYHTNIKVESFYASMDQIGQYIKSLYPKINLSTWSMSTQRHGEVRISIPDLSHSIILSKETVNSLKTWHTNTVSYEFCKQAWSFEYYGTDLHWLEDQLPTYLTVQTIKKLLEAQLVYKENSSFEELEEDLSNDSYRYNQNFDLFTILTSAYAYAKKTHCVLYASINT